MFLNPSLEAALDRISERAADVRRAFVPGALPVHDDAAAQRPSSTFTLDPLSVAAPDDGYFVIEDAAGNTAYTRDGSFAMRDGVLTSAGNRPILGFSTPNGALAPLRVDPVDDALGRITGLRIDAAGSLSYSRTTIDARTGLREPQRVVVGRIAIARFAAATRLRSVDGALFTAPQGVVAHTGVAGESGFATLRPMQREGSGVDLDTSLARLKAAYVAFDALAAAETAKGHLGKTVMDLLK